MSGTSEKSYILVTLYAISNMKSVFNYITLPLRVDKIIGDYTLRSREEAPADSNKYLPVK